jgi:hypothetical protein
VRCGFAAPHHNILQHVLAQHKNDTYEAESDG